MERFKRVTENLTICWYNIRVDFNYSIWFGSKQLVSLSYFSLSLPLSLKRKDYDRLPDLNPLLLRYGIRSLMYSPVTQMNTSVLHKNPHSAISVEDVLDRGYHPTHGTLLYYQHLGLSTDNQPRIVLHFINGFSFFGLLTDTL